MKEMRRRDFLRYSGYGLATILVGCGGGGGGGAAPGPGPGPDPGPSPGPDPGPVLDTLNFTITDAVKEMVTHEVGIPGDPLRPGNPAECYFWYYQCFEDAEFTIPRFPAECPGPQIFCIEGDRIAINVRNDLDGPHAFFIPGMVDSGPIQPGETWSGEIRAKDAGSYLYYDNLNAPVNRVMGLHGAFIVMPEEAKSGHKLTPYKDPTDAVQQLFDDFGTAPWWPGLSWEEGDEATNTAPTRQYIWLLHQASPVLFAEVGEFARANPGQDYPAAQFVNAFLKDPFVATSNDPRADTPANATFNRKPHFFTVNGQSGFFAHDHPNITPMLRVGEPCLVRILNAGLMTHSMHLHANHFYVTAVNNKPQENPLWLDVFNVHPMDHVDYTIPFMRPPDIPNERGIGRADAGLRLQGSLARTWPPVQEFDFHFPPPGTLVQSFLDPNVQVDLAQRQSPLCYPMHDHSEPSQVAQGGNYNCGLIAGVYFIGDRNGMMDFPLDHDFEFMLRGGGSTSATGPAAGNEIDHSHGQPSVQGGSTSSGTTGDTHGSHG